MKKTISLILALTLICSLFISANAANKPADDDIKSILNVMNIMTYDKNDGMYYGTQSWSKKQAAVCDGNTGDSVPFKNVLVLKTKLTFDGDGSHVYMELVGKGDGFLARDGQYVPIQWSRASEDDHFTFTLEDGTPVTFGVGKTFVSVLPTRSPEVIFE